MINNNVVRVVPKIDGNYLSDRFTNGYYVKLITAFDLSFKMVVVEENSFFFLFFIFPTENKDLNYFVLDYTLYSKDT